MIMTSADIKKKKADMAYDCFSVFNIIPKTVKTKTAMAKTIIICSKLSGIKDSNNPANKVFIPCAIEARIRVAVLSKK